MAFRVSILRKKVDFGGGNWVSTSEVGGSRMRIGLFVFLLYVDNRKKGGWFVSS